MQKVLTYQTSFIKDCYFIYNKNLQIGKLYKAEWVGSTIETTINEHNFRFVSKGFLKPVISIIDKKTKQAVGTATINNFLRISPSATLRLTGDQQYSWTTKGVFKFDWKWSDLTGKHSVITSTEPLDLFRQTGTINLTEQNDQAELLVALGIHLRNVVQRKTVMTRAIGVLSLTLSLLHYIR